MNSFSENVEQVILPEDIEMEPIASSKDDGNIENDETVRTSEKTNDSTSSKSENSEPTILSEGGETEPREPRKDGAINVHNEDFKCVLNELIQKHLSDSFKKYDQKMSDLEVRCHYAIEEVRKLKNQLVETRDDVDELDDRVQGVEGSTFANNELLKQALLRNNIVIFGVPPSERENLMGLLLAIAEAKSINVLPQDVCDITRANDRGASPTIVVKFNSMNVKMEFLQARKTIFLGDVFKSNSKRNSNNRIRMREDYTPHFREMMHIWQDAIRDGRLQDAWLTPEGLTLLHLDGTIENSIVFIHELKSIIDELPPPSKKPRQNRCQSSRARQTKNLKSKNGKRRPRRRQPRNKNHAKRQNQGIFQIERFLIFVSFHFRTPTLHTHTHTHKVQMGNSRQFEFG